MGRVRQTSLAVSLAMAVLATAGAAAAEDPAGGGTGPTTAPEAPAVAPSTIDLEKDRQSAALGADVPASPVEAPPLPPYRKSVVVEASLGALAFLGQFARTAPPAPWLRAQVGYELFTWLMLFGEGELAFTDTSRSQDPPRTRAFPIYGFGGGARFTARFTDRIGVYLQGSLGAMKADIRTNALGIIGFQDAESLGLYAGGRLGLEWYQVNRHFALGVTAGLRDATGFARQGGGGVSGAGAGADVPLVFDAGASIRYAF